MPARPAALVAVVALAGPAAADPAGVAFFEAKIRPVLVAECYSCHSADAAKAGKLKAGLAVDTRAGLLTGGESGPAVVPGKPADSLLVKSLRHAADAPEMPPKGKLPATVLADFEKWVAMGAPDPRAGPGVATKKGMTVAEGRSFWSLVPPTDAPPPAVRDPAFRAADPIDRWVQAGREARGLTGSPPADPRHLVRRLHFDLTGLPPAPEVADGFAADPSAAAYEKLIDDLLASPHYGERWGRHWLDAARYADSNGKDRNVVWYHAWRYRNYVLDGFNRDKPYREFVREQVAGDLLPASTPAERDERRVATGFLALGPKAFEEVKPDVFWMDVVDEQIEVVGRTVLGLSVACARCHDHKFDPIPTKDYYALAGIFRSTEPLHGPGPLGIKANVFAHTDLQPVGPDADTKAAAGRAYFAKLQALTLTRNTARSDRYRVVRRVADAKNQLAKPRADKAKLEADIARMEAEVKDWDAKLKGIDAELEAALAEDPPQPGWAMAARDRAAPADVRVHVRGETTSLGDRVPRGVLQVLPNPAAAVPAGESGRRQLADWLADDRNPLTARVWVNRVWQHLFGRGLVATPDDFGVNGSRPTHPELLDHLAVRFMADGWSTKRLIRAVVLSDTYRQSAGPDAGKHQADPENVYLWRMSPRRLEAEPLRDAVLSVAGRLDPARPAAEFLARFHPHRQAEHFSFSPVVKAEAIDSPHRSVYLPVVRGVLPEPFRVFDFADPERPVARREESTVPAQALYLLNNPWVIDQARHAARRLLADPAAEDDAARVTLLYRRAYGRPPTSDETRRAVAYLGRPESLAPDPKATPSADRLREERWASFCQAVFAAAEFRFLR